MAPKASRREPLDRDHIVTAATRLADEYGVDALSMRNVAGHLGCGVMSLYNHVANKDELLALMVDAVAVKVTEAPAETPPLAAIRNVAVSTRAAFVAHPWVPELWQRYLPGPARIRHMEQLLTLFADTGLSPELAHHGFHAVTNHVLGYTLQELSMTMGQDDLDTTARQFLAELEAGDYPNTAAHVQEHIEGNTTSSFELVLDLILDGLVRLDRAGTA